MTKETTPTTKVTSTLTVIPAHAVNIPMFQLLKEDGTVHKGAVLPEVSKELALKMFSTMQFIRLLDERMFAAQRQGRISFYLSSLGEEAASIGSAAAIEFEDMIMSQYREQGALAFRGFTVEDFMNQLFSNERDLGKGRQMPVHYGSAALNFMTISSPLGTQIPQAAGYAYGQKLEGNKNCTLVYFGEGAASEGDFHAGLNMAAVFKAPVIFFCRNNGYAISTPANEQYAGDGIAPRATGYGMKAIRVDGNDIFAVYKATQEARRIALEVGEPVLIEAMSYRMAGHSTSDDPSGYRTKEEEQQWHNKDPMLRFQKWLVAKGWMTEELAAEQMEAHKKAVLEELKKAETIPAPHVDEIITDVYDTPTDLQKEQLAALKEHIRKYPEAYPATAAGVK
ncbi:thiamine pyrophosphate-dependent dehydrogenase E1 component subunit alpha [Aliidiomarina quisquiliarum]|uniref:thiamine pyrophosphate-dependent dehydrogenase E1 component subunit alpha n=1 Tax=Aliidiomarina quisquiliarum TaxID=2938947 RepID=UPI00208E3999|nr:thiamine pyrophosphate-dependent dehydrogenase E1 component subunit alpha [Aliidiomarina quisquiliarum]MCO4320076.1 thiamine pyrophosphate-dependent dehydrogenase E1 component subunit alpha [Aliidiomarina quisquiliarum]